MLINSNLMNNQNLKYTLYCYRIIFKKNGNTQSKKSLFFEKLLQEKKVKYHNKTNCCSKSKTIRDILWQFLQKIYQNYDFTLKKFEIYNYNVIINYNSLKKTLYSVLNSSHNKCYVSENLCIMRKYLLNYYFT